MFTNPLFFAKMSLCFFLLGFSVLGFGQERENALTQTNPTEPMPLSDFEMSYRIEGSYSPYRFLEVHVRGDGQALMRYETYADFPAEPGVPSESGVKEKTFQLDPFRLEELREAYLAADFFNREVVDLNKEKITVTDVGTTTLSLKMDDEVRTISYGYAEGDPFREIIALYYQILDEQLPEMRERF